MASWPWLSALAFATSVALTHASPTLADDLNWKPKSAANTSSAAATTVRASGTTASASANGGNSTLRWRSPSRGARPAPTATAPMVEEEIAVQSPRVDRPAPAVATYRSTARIVLTSGDTTMDQEALDLFAEGDVEIDDDGRPRLFAASQPSDPSLVPNTLSPAPPSRLDSSMDELPPFGMDRATGPVDPKSMNINCDSEYSRLKPITDLTNSITAAGGVFPPECPVKYEDFMPRHFACTTYTWQASGLCHKPLYFEQVALERYGHSCGKFLQPLASGAHFFGEVALLPYNLAMDPPWECQYALGYYRPGDCAPYMIPPFPLSARGLAGMGAAAVGLVFLIP